MEDKIDTTDIENLTNKTTQEQAEEQEIDSRETIDQEIDSNNDNLENEDDISEESLDEELNEEPKVINDERFKAIDEPEIEEKDVSKVYFENLIKLQADFDNYRKRTDAEKDRMYNNGFVDAIVAFLPALDSFKMATEMITDQNTLVGIQYIEKNILNTLEKMGVKVIDTTGDFDPNFHQAIDVDTTSDLETGKIVKECYRGYILGDKILRHSQVIVKK